MNDAVNEIIDTIESSKRGQINTIESSRDGGAGSNRNALHQVPQIISSKNLSAKIKLKQNKTELSDSNLNKIKEVD